MNYPNLHPEFQTTKIRKKEEVIQLGGLYNAINNEAYSILSDDIALIIKEFLRKKHNTESLFAHHTQNRKAGGALSPAGASPTNLIGV